MTRILHIDSSLENADGSFSRRLSAAIVAALRHDRPQAHVTYRDLHSTPPPHIDGALRAGWMATADQRTQAQVEVVTRSEGYIAELKAADIIVIGAPMYNFSVPSSLKAWIDHVAIKGETFRYTPEGKQEGLLPGKKAYIASARGGVYSEGPATAFDHQELYLRSVLGFMGVTDVEVVRAEGLAFGPEPAQAALEAGLAEAAALAPPRLAA